jgi:hypothetical protein
MTSTSETSSLRLDQLPIEVFFPPLCLHPVLCRQPFCFSFFFFFSFFFSFLLISQILVRIAGFLMLPEYVSFVSVCRALHNITLDPTLWKVMLRFFSFFVH